MQVDTTDTLTLIRPDKFIRELPVLLHLSDPFTDPCKIPRGEKGVMYKAVPLVYKMCAQIFKQCSQIHQVNLIIIIFL